jgi:hypothetical protein
MEWKTLTYDAVIYEIKIGDKYYVGSTKNLRCRKNAYNRQFKNIKEDIDLIKELCGDDLYNINSGLRTYKKEHNKSFGLNPYMVCAFIENDYEFTLTPFKNINVKNMTEQRCVEGELFIQYRECYGVRNMMNYHTLFPQ